MDAQSMLKTVSCQDVMQAVEDALIAFSRGEVRNVDRSTASNEPNSILFMPCFAKKVFGVKMLYEFPGNPAKGLPFLSGIMVLNDAETGEILAIMNGTELTALRTGAVGGMAIKHLAFPDSKTVGLVGCGAQGLYQLYYACSAANISDIYLFDAYKKDLTGFTDTLSAMVDRSVYKRTLCGNRQSSGKEWG